MMLIKVPLTNNNLYMTKTITLTVIVNLAIESETPKEIKDEAKQMGSYLSDHIKEDLPGKWSGLAEVETVSVKVAL